MITQIELQEQFNYDADTGIFTWKVSHVKVKAGQVAGCCRPNGYVTINYNKTFYLAHRLAWLYVYGELPDNCLDHINCVRNDNRISNLRNATTQQNNYNSKLSITNKSGVKGVYWMKNKNKWAVQICFNKIQKHIGLFNDLEFAKFVANEVRNKYHQEFARSF